MKRNMGGAGGSALLRALVVWCAILTVSILALTGYLISGARLHQVPCNCTEPTRQNLVQDQRRMAPTPQPWKTRNEEQRRNHFDVLQGSKETPIIHLKLDNVPQKKTLLWNLSHPYSYNRSILYQDHGSILFGETGFYYVYSQLTLKVTTNGAFSLKIEQKTPHLPHPVTLGSTVAQGNVSQNIALALSVAYCFETDTEIYIDIEHPEDVQPQHWKTFFGAFQVSHARSCSKTIT